MLGGRGGTMKRIQRLAQRGVEALGRGDKTDKLTAKLADIERKVEGIRNGCLVTIKKLSATFVGSGAGLDKHQKKIPQYSLGVSMMEAGWALKDCQKDSQSLFGVVLDMVGQAQIDIAAQMSQYEISVMHDIIQELNMMLEDDCKKVDKAKKKLGTVRLDMDAARTRLKGYEAHVEKATREYNMEKLVNMRQEVDECSKAFDDAQDHYATEMYDFLSKEQVYTTKIQELVKLQITHYKNAAVQLEGMLPTFEKKMNASRLRPVFGAPLDDHLANSKKGIATVLEVCCSTIREQYMETEGMFRIAASTARVKFLKSSFDAGQTDVSGHDSHTIAGCLKMYLRELPEPLLTFDLYSDWIKAAGIGNPEDRLQAVWTVKEQLPKSHLANLQYLMGFLYEFSLYSDITKMTINNIAIVIGPNMLWPREESADPLNMVTDTAMQRRLTETMIEHCHWMFPGLPEPPSPPLSSQSSLTPSNSFSSSQSIPPLSPRVPSDTASISSTGSTGSRGSPAPAPVPRPRDRPPERDQPHPLADHALSEGVTVQMIESKGTPVESTPSPKSKKMPPPVAPYKPAHAPLASSKSDPPSPVPKPRPSSQGLALARTPSGGDFPAENGEACFDHSPASRPTPPIRPKRAVEPPPTSNKPSTSNKPPTTPGKLGSLGRGGPSRRAPPPPVGRKPLTQNHEDEVSAL